ncbi:hypothetical protein B0H12DRAFT_1241151 [Mycena haematopus]|nr:hypothetical protein B0H12DRAFT_1241151 [Mycena haematopus]
MPFPEPGTRSQMNSLDSTTLRTSTFVPARCSPFQHFLEDTHAQTSFHNLHVHRPFPVIRELNVKVRPQADFGALPSLATPIAPHLAIYQGPPGLLPLILLKTAPHTINIWRDYAPELLRALRNCGRATIPSVTSLAVNTQFPDISVGSALGDSLAFFPLLDALTVVVDSGRYHAPPGTPRPRPPTARAVCAHLATALRSAQTLRTVVFKWRLDLGDPYENAPPLVLLERVLREALSGLESVQYLNGWI